MPGLRIRGPPRTKTSHFLGVKVQTGKLNLCMGRQLNWRIIRKLCKLIQTREFSLQFLFRHSVVDGVSTTMAFLCSTIIITWRKLNKGITLWKTVWNACEMRNSELRKTKKKQKKELRWWWMQGKGTTPIWSRRSNGWMKKKDNEPDRRRKTTSSKKHDATTCSSSVSSGWCAITTRNWRREKWTSTWT